MKALPQDSKPTSFVTGLWQSGRLVWMAAALLLGIGLYAIAGGGGLFTHRTIGDATFSIRYPVVMRQQTDGEFIITVTDPKGSAVLHFDKPFRDRFAITNMTPQPTATFDTSWGRAYRFALPDTGPGTVQIDVAAAGTGQVNYSIMTDGRMAMLSTVVLP